MKSIKKKRLILSSNPTQLMKRTKSQKEQDLERCITTIKLKKKNESWLTIIKEKRPLLASLI